MRISDWSSDVCSSDLAAAWPRHDGGAALGSLGCDLRGQGPLGLVLHRSIDREHQVVTALGALELALPRRDGATLGVLLDDQLTRLTGEEVVVLGLQPGYAHAVDVDGAEHGAGKVVCGPHPPRPEERRVG